MAAIATVTSYEYAAGTCTLRLVGELSPLSQVTGRPVLGRSRFHLQMQGDDALREARTLASRAMLLEISGREPQFSTLAELVQTYVQNYLNADAIAAGGAVARGENSLQPVGLTRHRLTLAVPPEPPRVVELSTLQLSDLADALEQADSNLQILPDAAVPKTRRVRPKLPLWLGSVAAVGIAALLGNQLLTTAPSSVVLSPSEESQPTNGSTTQNSADNPQLTPAEPAPTAANTPTAEDSAPAAAGEALPAPITTAPTGPAVPAPTSPGAPSGSAPEPGTPKASPPSAASPAPAQPSQSEPAPTPANPAQAEARAGGQAAPDASIATEQAPNAAQPEARTAPASPEAFDTGPSIAATTGPDSAIAWIGNLTQALEQQWRPPANLAAPLRYRLVLEPDGTVTALEPLNDFSASYQNNATLPQAGDTIPGVVKDASTTVEVQFLPTGAVVIANP
ncbi:MULTISPECIES: DUF4335 domain-containing protein [Cyanophyceae]|uniref:DUF4335 domain-containing protein n=1 Tax=Cyanophyceae TaxID=3028117 RepID=UPI001687B890|nr:MULTISPECIES: DUF4335 domain-containing protein [Cyanophyceae]MBD1919031.1 DUF4335 domain-containing protein [Phormidium sp. FACHB-77]MBD2031993.1 DUF4335 domain-containing protein [Phormidium sp. FACHB-322]MBD2053956.1 DUF4335 domain-containing protein [Leptolyngbya sp. FACHB-60]